MGSCRSGLNPTLRQIVWFSPLEATIPGMPSIIHHPSVKATAKFLEGQCPFYGHAASWSFISTMQSYCPSRPLGGWWNVAPGWSWGVLLQLRPVMDVTQMWRLICVNNSWDAWGIMKKSSRKITPPICRHLFACLLKPQFPIFFISRNPLWKSKAVRVHWTPLPWAAFLLWLDVTASWWCFRHGWWMIKDSDVILTWFKNICNYVSQRVHIYIYIDVLIIFWWTLDTLRHLFGTQYNHPTTGRFFENGVWPTLCKVCVCLNSMKYRIVWNHMESQMGLHVWCLSNSHKKRHEFGKMSRAQVIVPIFLDQFYHSDLVNAAWCLKRRCVWCSTKIRISALWTWVLGWSANQNSGGCMLQWVPVFEDDTPLSLQMPTLDVLCFPCRFYSSTLTF